MVMEHLQYAKHCARHMENTEGSGFYPQWAHSLLKKRYYSIKVEYHNIAIAKVAGLKSHSTADQLETLGKLLSVTKLQLPHANPNS